MSWPLLILFLGASVLLTLAPGTNNVAVLMRGISQGRRAGLVGTWKKS